MRGGNDNAHGKDIGLKSALDLLGCNILEFFLHMQFAGVIDENVEAAKMFDGFGDRGNAEIRIADIAANQRAQH